MKTNVTSTSLDAFYDLKTSPKLQDQQRKIINVMRPHVVYSRRFISMLTGMEISSVSARINSLLGTHIEVVGHIKDPITKKTVQGLVLKVAA